MARIDRVKSAQKACFAWRTEGQGFLGPGPTTNSATVDTDDFTDTFSDTSTSFRHIVVKLREGIDHLHSTPDVRGATAPVPVGSHWGRILHALNPM